jgi:hypothetical protein
MSRRSSDLPWIEALREARAGSRPGPLAIPSVPLSAMDRPDFTPLAFAASLVATVAIACLAVGGQALRASRVEPAEVLRYQ